MLLWPSSVATTRSSCAAEHSQTSYEPIRRLRSRSQERIKPISSAPEAQGKVWRSQSRYPLHRFDRNPVVEVNRWRLAPIVQEERAHFPYHGPCEHGRRHFWQSHLALFVRLKSVPRAEARRQRPEFTGARGKGEPVERGAGDEMRRATLLPSA